MRQATRWRMHRLIIPAIAMAAVIMAAGCCCGGGEVRMPLRGELERSFTLVSPGMTKEEVFAALPRQGSRERLSVATRDDATAEEWQIRDWWSVFIEVNGATEQEESGRGYLYFIDDRLVKISKERLTEQDRQSLFERAQPVPPR